ncbi:MAG: efflux RND transporter periplasmic adaptor subunit [Planctomycetes bacterium]|nr:efflux RND transporter periplasmic adaptor subunit [Planctomycetota bacterium]
MRVALRRIILAAFALAVIAVLVYAFLPEPVPVDLAQVTRGPMRVSVDEDGKTRIKERYVVSAPLVGRLQRIELDPGDVVEANLTIVAIIEPTAPHLLDARARAEAQARVRAAEAAISRANAKLQQAKAAYDFAEAEHARAQAAFDRGGASPHEIDEKAMLKKTAGEERRAAAFAEEIAEFELELSRSALLHTMPQVKGDELSEHFEIRSPISGCVLRVLRQSMTVVEPGAPLMELGDPTDLEVVIDVLSTDAVKISPGAKVIIDRWGGDDPLLATVRLVEPSAFTKVSALGVEEQRVNVIADFITPLSDREFLGDGYRVEAKLVIWEADDIVQAPASALFRKEGGWALFVADDDQAVLRPVEIGWQNGLMAQVLGGVEPGQLVIVYPSDEIEHGISITPRDES